MTDTASPVLRDFFYLDIDRVRSLVAQLREGMPEAVERQTVHHGRGGLKLVEYAYERTQTETRSVHHYIFSLLEEILKKASRLELIDNSFDDAKWNASHLRDGLILLVEGYIRLVDFQKLIEAVEALPNILKVAQQMEKVTLRKRLQAGDVTQAQYKSAVNGQGEVAMDKRDFRGVVDIVRQMYADTLRIKVFPFPEKRDHYLTGVLTAEYLQQPRANLWLTGGVESRSKWWAMGIINQLTTEHNAPAAGGATLEDFLESLFLSFSEVSKVTTSTAFPAVSFTPLAIYRKL